MQKHLHAFSCSKCIILHYLLNVVLKKIELKVHQKASLRLAQEGILQVSTCSFAFALPPGSFVFHSLLSLKQRLSATSNYLIVL